MKFRCGFAFVALLAVCQPACGQSWAVGMFASTSHDFGVVARGAKVEYEFVLQNVYEEDVHIASVRSSCGCTTPEVSKSLVKTWEKSSIRAIIDTRGFFGRKDATLTVVFDKPFPAEVQLNVYTFIRSDVVVQPGVVKFGNVVQGRPARQTVQVSYAGRADWQIVRVESANSHLIGEVVETERSATGVKYDLTVTLTPSTPAGYIQDHLVLVTNDYAASASRVPVPVEGIVGAGLRAHPSPLMLVAEPGQTITRSLVVQGHQPFRIMQAQCADPRVKLVASSEAKPLQLVVVSFTGGAASGTLNASIHVETDVPGVKPLDVPVQLQVAPAQTARAPTAKGPEEH